MTTCTSTLLMLSMASLVMGMDYGSAGVYDSPMATDYYVQRFGFLFGGGRSGMKGMMAIKVRFDLQERNQWAFLFSLYLSSVLWYFGSSNFFCLSLIINYCVG